MSFSYKGQNSAVGTGVTELGCNLPAGTAVGDIIVAVFAFENVGATSGPWIIPNIGQFPNQYIGPDTDWWQACWQAPSAAGVGIEVWWAILESGTNFFAKFVTSRSASLVCTSYSGEYNPTGRVNPDTVRLAPTAQVVGDQPPAPAVNANAGELLVACGGDLMTASKFGTPSGFTSRVDVARAGAGTVDATIADAVAPAAGDTGPITFPNAAAASATAGATATLAIRPVPAATGVGGVMDAPLPEELDLGAGYTLRVTTVDPVTGDRVGGTSIGTVVITASAVDVGSGEGSEPGSWFLVPGSEA